MSEHKGPVYGVPLIRSLPLGEKGGMTQAMPSSADLQSLLRSRVPCKDRVAAGYEVLLAHYHEVTAQRDEALSLLADWCMRVDKVGSGWDDWDTAYKNAMYGETPIRALLDAKIAHAVKVHEAYPFAVDEATT